MHAPVRPRPTILAAALVAALLVGPPLARAATVDVAVGGTGFSFSPQTVNIHVGDSVRFTNQGGFHNVAADNGSFRCAESCSGTGGDPSGSSWSFTIQYSQAGTFGHHCEVHGSPGSGMFGTVIVAAASQPGTLSFDHSASSVGEAGGAATITVDRQNGDSGAVTVHYATSNGTATAGQDYTAASGTLSWADGDGTAKTFQVPITNDTLHEPNETVHLTLSSPTGGATLGTSSATLTIIDNDTGGGGTAPSAPTGLTASASSTSEIQLHWTDTSSNETGFRVQMRALDGSAFADAGPLLPPGSTSTVIDSLDAGAGYGFRVRAENAAGSSAYSAEAQAATDTALPASCATDATTLCLSNRFRARVAWKTPDGSTGQGSAVPIASAPQSGLFYFFSATNIEMLLKVLNACSPALGNKYWTFYAATTNVQFALTVVDTQTGKTRVYFNPQGQAAPPVQDTNAFATCP